MYMAIKIALGVVGGLLGFTAFQFVLQVSGGNPLEVVKLTTHLIVGIACTKYVFNPN